MWSVAAVTLVLLFGASHALDSEVEAIDYFRQYGYLDTGSGAYEDSTSFTDAIKKFQDFAGLEKTGELDKNTKELIQTPRCGVEDKIANFVLHGSKWEKKDLTYRISKYPSTQGLSKNDVDLTTRKAFSMWREASDLKFKETSFGPVDIEIRFERYNHGDGNNFDGPGGVLAHAFFPRFGGDAHFDDSENWSVTPFAGNQLLNTLTHEFGHSLGLSHSKVSGSIMAPFYKGWDPNLKIGEDDRKGIQSLYGKTKKITTTQTERPFFFPTKRSSTSKPPIGRTETPVRFTTGRTLSFTTRKSIFPDSDNIDLCRSNIDAIVQSYDGTSYVFNGDNYWKLTNDGVDPGYPRKISQDWPGLPGNIDAALTWKQTKNTYFFKGDQYWKFQGQSPLPGYPKDVRNWPGLPTNLDAAFQWGKDEDLYFFKGSQFWKYNTDLKTMSAGYPRDISAWKNVPSNVDAALQWSNGKTYFFKSGNYWKFDDKTLAVDRNNPTWATFPRDAGKWWFGCSKTKDSPS